MNDLVSEPIVPLADSHDRRAFKCGAEPLDRYFHSQAGQDQRRRIAACFVLVDREQGRVAGYYTLSAFSVLGEDLPPALLKKLPRYDQIPATLLGRLAIDQIYRSRGLGSHLLVDALKRSLVHSRQVASWAVVVDAKDESAVAFYVRHGFIALPSARDRLFLPMKTIAELFA